MNSRVEIKVRGRVQGVAFRWYTQRQARALAVTGWVRNEADGSVRLLAEGPQSALEALADWVAQGPDRARVDEVNCFWGDPSGKFSVFTITG